MNYLGDFTTSKVIRMRFNTHKADGTPITLAGTPAVSVYKNSVTESTSGVTLTVDYDSRTGMHLVAIDTSSDGTFYAAGENYDIVLTAGTVDSISVVGTVVGCFSLANRSALRPATADQTIIASNLDASVAAVKAKTDNLPSDPADASDIASAFSTVNSTLSTIAGYIDTEIAAIKTKTDGLPSDTATTLTTIQGYVDTLETELAKVLKTGESRTIARSGKTSITFTETRA